MADTTGRDKEQPENSGASGARAASEKTKTSGKDGGCSNDRKMSDFISKSSSILDKFTGAMQGFEKKASQIDSLVQEVNQLKQSLKKRENTASADSDASPTKQAKYKPTIEVDEDSDDSDIETLLNRPKQHAENVPEDSPFFDDFEDFFGEEQQVGDNIQDHVAKKLNKALRPSKTDSTAVKDLVDSYKRPQNMDALQCPRIDGFLWRQLKTSTKAQDAQKQATVKHLNRAAIPLVKALDHACSSNTPDSALLTKCVWDSFKFMCDSIHSVNQSRRQEVRKELSPKFKVLCSEDHPTSALGLFGDNLQEASKALDATKNIQMTNTTITSRQNQLPFLGKGKGGDHNNRPFQNPHPSQQSTFKPQGRQYGHQHNQQNRQKPWHHLKVKSDNYGHNSHKSRQQRR